MNLHHLAVFHAIAKAGSVAAAAQELHISQPAISRELKTLENRLGVTLFDRMPRGMRLTEAGKVLDGYAVRIFALERAAETALADISGLSGGSLMLGASNTIGTYLLPVWLAAFRKLHPLVSLGIDIVNTETVARGIAEFRYELGFVEGPVAGTGFSVTVLREDRIVAVVAPDHHWAGSKRISPRALADTPSLMRESGSGTRDIVEQAFAQRGLQLQQLMEIGNSEAVKRAAIAGAGVAWLSELSVSDALQAGQLVVLNTPGLALRRTLHSLRLRDRALSPSTQAFVELISQTPSA